MKQHTGAWIAATVVTAAAATYVATENRTVQSVPFPEELLTYNAYPFEAVCVAPHLRRAVAYSGGTNGMMVRQGERDSQPSAAWTKHESVETVSFKVTDVDARLGGDDVFVAGIADDGRTLLERWAYPVRKNGYGIALTSGPVAPIGTVTAEYAAAQELNGDEYEPATASYLRFAQRSVIYRGTGLGYIRSVLADPEGRFVLFLTYPGQSLYRLRLEPNATPELLYSVTTLPHLADVESMQLWRHESLGRIYVLNEPRDYETGHSTTYLQDADNDGLFETVVTLTGVHWQAFREANQPFESFSNTGVEFDW